MEVRHLRSRRSSSFRHDSGNCILQLADLEGSQSDQQRELERDLNEFLKRYLLVRNRPDYQDWPEHQHIYDQLRPYMHGHTRHQLHVLRGHPTNISRWDTRSGTWGAIHRRKLELHRLNQLQFSRSRSNHPAGGESHKYRSQHNIQRIRQALHQPGCLRGKRDRGLGVGPASVDMAELEHHEWRDDLAGRQHPDVATSRGAVVLRHSGSHLGSVPDAQQSDVHVPVFRNSTGEWVERVG